MLRTVQKIFCWKHCVWTWHCLPKYALLILFKSTEIIKMLLTLVQCGNCRDWNVSTLYTLFNQDVKQYFFFAWLQQGEAHESRDTGNTFSFTFSHPCKKGLWDRWLGSSQTHEEGSGTVMAQERAPSSEKPLLAETVPYKSPTNQWLTQPSPTYLITSEAILSEVAW